MDQSKGSRDQDDQKSETDDKPEAIVVSEIQNSADKARSKHSADNGSHKDTKREVTDVAENIGNNHCSVNSSLSNISTISNNCDSGSQLRSSQSEGASAIGFDCSDYLYKASTVQKEIQNDSALCVSPKSVCSTMDTSCDKIFDTSNTEITDNDQKTESTSGSYNARQDDSGICFERHDSDCNMKTDEVLLKTSDSNNTAENNCKMSEVKIDCEAECSSLQKDTTVNSDDNQSCDKNVSKATKVLDSDDLSPEETTQKNKKKTKKLESSTLDSDDNSDTPGLQSQVNPSKKTDKNGETDSGNSDIEQEMDALDLLLSRRKRRHDSDHSDSSHDEEGDRTAPIDEDDDHDETKSESDHSEGDENDYDFTPPHDPWSPLKEMRAREIGFGNKLDSPHRFRSRCGSSVRFTQKLKRLCKLEHHDGCVNALHFNKSGTLLASGSDDLNVVVWDWLNNKPYFDFDSGHRSNVFQCKFMPYTGDSHIVSCARDGQIRLAELSSTGMCKGTKKLAQHRGAAHKLALLEDSSHVFYSCGEDAVVYEIDLRQDKPNKLCTTKEKDKKIPLYSIHSNPLKSYEYCVGGRDHFLRVYDKRMLDGDGSVDNVLKKYCPHHLVDSDIKANVTCAVYNWDGQEVLGTYNDEDIYLFDNAHSDGAEHVHKYTGHRNNATVKGINFYGPKSEFVVSGSDCGNVFLWDKKSEKIVNYFHADDGGVVNVLEPHPHMPVLATSGLDHDIKIWMPMGCEASKMDGLAKRIKKNQKERDRERLSEPEMLDGRMLWFLMQHLRRTRRRPGDNGDSSTDSDDVERGETDHSDNDDEEPMQCMPS